MKKYKFPFIIILLFATSCTSVRYSANFQRANVKSLGYTSPCINLYLISEGNVAEYSKINSDSLQHKMISYLEYYKTTFKLFYNKSSKESEQNIQKSVFEICDLLYKNKRPDTITLNNILLNQIDSYKERYIMFSAINGYSRTKKNMINQEIQSAAIGILTLGMMIPLTNEGSSKLVIFVVDKESKKIVYSNRNFVKDKSPFFIASQQYQNILRDFWEIEDDF
jgi:hypothetical protein